MRQAYPTHADAASPAELAAAARLAPDAGDAAALEQAALFSVHGRMSTFGGPQDTGVEPDEDLSLFDRRDVTDPRFAGLFLRSQPPRTTGAARRLDPEAFYLACRWDFHRTPRSLLRATTATVTNLRTGRSAEARPADWGPNAHTGRVADLSPGLAAELDLDTDDEVAVTLLGHADPGEKAPTGQDAGAASSFTPPRVFTTAEWGAAPARSDSFAEHAMEGIVIHNTEGSNRAPFGDPDREREAAFANAREIQQSHMVTDHHWLDTGQHFTISRGGVITEGRHGSLAAARAGRVVQAAHATGTRFNERWFGIEMAGDNRVSLQVTDSQWASLIELCAWLTFWRDAGNQPIEGHLDVKRNPDGSPGTDCPGKLEGKLDDLRVAVADRLAQLGRGPSPAVAVSVVRSAVLETVSIPGARPGAPARLHPGRHEPRSSVLPRRRAR